MITGLEKRSCLDLTDVCSHIAAGFRRGMARINLGIILESLESELRRAFRAVVSEDHTNAKFREFRKRIVKDQTWYTVPDHLVEKD